MYFDILVKRSLLLIFIFALSCFKIANATTYSWSAYVAGSLTYSTAGMTSVVTNTSFDNLGPQDPNGGSGSGYNCPKYVNNATINTYQGGFTSDYGMQGLVLGVDWTNLTSTTTLTITFTTPVSGPLTFNIYDINLGDAGGYDPTFIDKVTISGTNCAGASIYPTVSGCSNSISGSNSNIITGTLGCTNTTNTITFNAPSVKTITITYASSSPLASGYGSDPDPQYIIISDITANVSPLVAISPVGAGITCSSPTVTLTGSSSIPSATYSWMGPNSSSPAGTTPTSSSTVVSVGGTYLLVVTDPSSGCKDSATVVVNQSGTPPNLTLNPPATLSCTNTSVTLTASSTTSGVTYAWSGGGTGATKNVTTPGPYTVTATASGCTATASVTVSQNITAPNVSITPPGSLSCSVSSITLTASSTTGGVSYAWSGGGTATTKTITTIGAYSVTVTDSSNGCTSSSSVTVTGTSGQNAGPDQTVSCYPSNNSATMAATGAGTWAAESGNPGTAVITSTTLPTTTITSYSTAGTFYFIWASGACADTVAVLVQTKPDAGTDQIVRCATLPGGTATMAATGSGTWSAQTGNPGSATIINTTGPSTTITAFSAAGLYNFIWTNSGCSDTASVLVTAAPTLSPSVVNITCTNPTGIIYANANGIGPFTYQWSNTTTADSLVTTLPGTLYTLTVTDQTTCTATVSDSVSTLGVTLAYADSVTDESCVGNDGKIILYVSPTGNYTYTWSVPGATDSITGLTGGTYYVTVSNAQGCQITASIIVGTNGRPAAPSITAGGPTSFCQGDSVVLTSSATTGNTWSNGATAQSITVLASGSYTVTQTLGTCTGPPSAATVVTVNPIPAAPVITASGPVSFCQGDSVTLTSSLANGNLWSDGETTSSIVVHAAGSYTVYDTQNGCASPVSAPVIVTLTASPQPAIVPSALFICADSSVTLDATTIPASAYLWSTNATTPTISVSSPGTYQVTVTANGCSGTNSITLNSIPQLGTLFLNDTTSLCFGDSLTLNATTLNATSYMWSGAISSSSPVVTVSTAGLYSVTVSNSCGSLDRSTLVTIYDCQCNIVMPNAFTPNGDGSNDLYGPVFNCDNPKSLLMQIFNRWGEKVYETSDLYGQWDGKYKETDQAPGVYVFYLEFIGLQNNLERSYKLMGSLTLMR